MIQIGKSSIGQAWNWVNGNALEKKSTKRGLF